MNDWAAIRYRDFWDVPRIFFAEYGGRLYLFDCQFDEAVEDYPESYQVFLMPPLAETDYAGSWAGHWRRAVQKLGDVPIAAVTFDPTKRQAIRPDVFARLAALPPSPNGHQDDATRPARVP